MRTLQVSRARLARWDVKHLSGASWSPEVTGTLKAIGSVAVERSERSPAGVPLGSISFDGVISPRSESRSAKGKLFVARPGDLVFSRIDIRNGAVGVLAE